LGVEGLNFVHVFFNALDQLHMFFLKRWGQASQLFGAKHGQREAHMKCVAQIWPFADHLGRDQLMFLQHIDQAGQHAFFCGMIIDATDQLAAVGEPQDIHQGAQRGVADGIAAVAVRAQQQVKHPGIAPNQAHPIGDFVVGQQLIADQLGVGDIALKFNR
jgi:hypothetical protein